MNLFELFRFKYVKREFFTCIGVADDVACALVCRRVAPYAYAMWLKLVCVIRG